MTIYQHYIDVRGEVLPTPRRTTTAAATYLPKYFLNKMSAVDKDTRKFSACIDVKTDLCCLSSFICDICIGAEQIEIRRQRTR